MEAKEAVAAAKTYFRDLSPDDPTPTLEEIWFEDQGGLWCVTLGVGRPSHHGGIGIGAPSGQSLAYKVVRIRDKDGKPISIKNREGERVA